MTTNAVLLLLWKIYSHHSIRWVIEFCPIRWIFYILANTHGARKNPYKSTHEKRKTTSNTFDFSFVYTMDSTSNSTVFKPGIPRYINFSYVIIAALCLIICLLMVLCEFLRRRWQHCKEPYSDSASPQTSSSTTSSTNTNSNDSPSQTLIPNV